MSAQLKQLLELEETTPHWGFTKDLNPNDKQGGGHIYNNDTWSPREEGECRQVETAEHGARDTRCLLLPKIVLRQPRHTQPHPQDGIHTLCSPCQRQGPWVGKHLGVCPERWVGKHLGIDPLGVREGQFAATKDLKRILWKNKEPFPPQFWQFPDGKLKWNFFFKCSETFWTSLVFISYGSAQKKYINLWLF